MSALSKLLGVFSGNNGEKLSEQLLFDKVIGFKGVVPGVGTSTYVQNVAIALSENTNYSICVLDTGYLYPTSYPMLVGDNKESDKKDYLDFSDELSDVVSDTLYPNVHLLSLNNRGIADILGSKDSEELANRVIGALKTHFDIILVDLSYELTNVSIRTAVKCNKIIYVSDQSLKSVYHLKKALNMSASLAIPFAKANTVVLNKVVPDVLTNTQAVLEKTGLTVVGEMPLSIEIAKYGVSGKRIYEDSTHRDVVTFSDLIDELVSIVTSKTPLTEKYINKKDIAESSSNLQDSPSKETVSEVAPTVTDDEVEKEVDEEEIDLFASEDSVEDNKDDSNGVSK